ncbi:hypothetical protein [Psychromonas sp. SP041]|uniref:hypothetical protein n=1 Tax=Psychromonas sp. SP041 TaxID=1365007 RepID=UPI0010C781BA|nr:hypothetical protein [Psychromonas sp. SP041]
MPTQQYKSKKEFFLAAENKEVTRTMDGGLSLDEWDDWVKQTTEALISQGCAPENIELNDNSLSIKNSNQFWMKPKTPRIMTGEIHSRSKDFYFKSDQFSTGEAASFCDKSKATLTEFGLEVVMLNGAKLEYTITG